MNRIAVVSVALVALAATASAAEGNVYVPGDSVKQWQVKPDGFLAAIKEGGFGVSDQLITYLQDLIPVLGPLVAAAVIFTGALLIWSCCNCCRCGCLGRTTGRKDCSPRGKKFAIVSLIGSVAGVVIVVILGLANNTAQETALKSTLDTISFVASWSTGNTDNTAEAIASSIDIEQKATLAANAYFCETSQETFTGDAATGYTFDTASCNSDATITLVNYWAITGDGVAAGNTGTMERDVQAMRAAVVDNMTPFRVDGIDALSSMTSGIDLSGVSDISGAIEAVEKPRGTGTMAALGLILVLILLMGTLAAMELNGRGRCESGRGFGCFKLILSQIFMVLFIIVWLLSIVLVLWSIVQADFCTNPYQLVGSFLPAVSVENSQDLAPTCATAADCSTSSGAGGFYVQPTCDAGNCATNLMSYYLECGAYTAAETYRKDPLVAAGDEIDKYFDIARTKGIEMLCNMKTQEMAATAWIALCGATNLAADPPIATDYDCNNYPLSNQADDPVAPGTGGTAFQCNSCIVRAQADGLSVIGRCASDGPTAVALDNLYAAFERVRLASGAQTVAQKAAFEPRIGLLEGTACAGLNSRINSMMNLLCVDIFEAISSLAVIFIVMGVLMTLTDCTRRIVRPGRKDDTQLEGDFIEG